VNGRPVLRVCIINHATRAEHVEGLLASVLRIGRELLAGGEKQPRELHRPLADNR
jgi:hypothetical protein